MAPVRIPIVAGNWKMHTTIDEARRLASDVARRLIQVRGVDVVLCPPYVSLQALSETVGALFVAGSLQFPDRENHVREAVQGPR